MSGSELQADGAVSRPAFLLLLAREEHQNAFGQMVSSWNHYSLEHKLNLLGRVLQYDFAKAMHFCIAEAMHWKLTVENVLNFCIFCVLSV